MDFLYGWGVDFGIVFLVALAISALGFYRYLYFISLGYGFSVAALGMVLFFMTKETAAPFYVVSCLLLLVYGLRLGGYLFLREWKSGAYRAAMLRDSVDVSSVGVVAKLCTWVGCALLYSAQVSPVLFLGVSGGFGIFAVLGTIVMAVGLLVESWADWQKTKAKKETPNRFCDKGLYRLVRCPNYFGEILFWTGAFLSGVGSMQGIWQWLIAGLGYLCIVYIMFGGARRLELRQDKNYGQDEAYQAYAKSTPILLPFVPLYSVKKHTWLIG